MLIILSILPFLNILEVRNSSSLQAIAAFLMQPVDLKFQGVVFSVL